MQRRAAGRATRRGFSLVEVALATGILSILLVAIASAIILAGKAIPTGSTPAERAFEAARVAGQITDELRGAVHITERSAAAITFTVADRSGDGIPERIRYAWSSAPGDPLTRQYNDGAAATVLEDVHQFDLAYHLKTVNEQYPGVPVESAETELRSYDSTDDLSDLHVHDDRWWAQYFKPTLAPDAISWSVTRVKFMAKRDHNDAYDTTIQLRLPMPDNMPSDTVVDSATMAQLSLTDAHQWVEKSFSNATGLSPSQGLCLSFITTDPNSCQLRHQDRSVSLPDAGLIEGTPSWENLYTDKALLFYVYGTCTTPGSPQTATRQYVTAVRMALQAGENAASEIGTSIQTLNAPEVLSAVWEADFSGDPTQIDLNGDGVADWLAGGGSFDVGQLSGGTYWADGTLNTNPAFDFQELTTVYVRLRNTIANGEAAGVKLRIDRTGDTYGYILAEVEKMPDGTQTLIVSTYDASLEYGAVVTETGLSDGFIDLRILVDPGQNTLNVKINSQDRGTYRYGRITASTDHVIRLYETDPASGAQFDHVCIRVGGKGS